MAGILSWAAKTENNLNPFQAAAQQPKAAPKPPQPVQKKQNILQRAVGDVAAPINRDIVQPINHNVVQPVAHFATPVVQTAKALGGAAVDVGLKLPINTARTAMAEATGNQKAQAHATKLAYQNLDTLKGVAQGIPRAGYQLAESMNPAGGDVRTRSHTFGGPFSALMGTAPVDSMQKTYQDTAKTKGNANAAGGAVTTAIMDALGGKQLASAGLKALPEGVRSTVSTGAKEAVDSVKPATVAAKHPAVQELDNTYKNMQKQYDNASSSTVKNQLNKAMASNRHDRVATVKAVAQGGYIGKGKGVPGLPTSRPNDALQTQIETAHNAGDTAAETKLTAQLKDPAMNPNYKMPASQRAALLAKMTKPQKVGATAEPLSSTPKTAPLPADNLDQTQVKPVSLDDNNTLPPKLKTSGGVKTVKGSKEVSQQVKPLVANKYAVTHNVDANAASEATLADKGLATMNDSVIKNLNNSKALSGAQDTSDAIQVAKAHDAAGNSSAAADIYNKLAAKLTKQGQGNQAIAILSRRSPEGLRNSAIQAIIDHNKAYKTFEDIPKNVHDAVQTAYKDIKATKEGTQERNEALENMQKVINQNSHASLGAKAFTLWRTGLLSGPLTMTKVAASHILQNGLETVKQAPAVAIDRALSHFTGQRSTAFTPKGVTEAGTGFKASAHLMRTGHDTMGTGGFGGGIKEIGKPDVSFGTSTAGKVADFYVQKVGQIHAAIPKAFFTAAQANDLFKQGIASAKTAGLKGSEYSEHVKNFVENASDAAKAEADKSARMATFQQDSKLSQLAGGLQKAPGGKFVAPFAKVASNILDDVASYSPVGAVRAIYNAIKEKGTDGWTPTVQKHFVEELGRSITGTGAMYIGAQLYNNGDLTLGYPSNPQEQALWAQEGKTADSIKMGGKWRSTASLGPTSTLLAAGGYAAQSKDTSGKGKSELPDAIAGAANNITGQSYLSGVEGLASAVQNPKENLNAYAKQTAASVVPIAVSTVAKATDPEQRKVNNPLQAVENTLPGVRENLPTKSDPFGATEKREGSVVSNLIDPTRPSNDTSTPLTSELDRLYKTTGSTAIPQQPKSSANLQLKGSEGQQITQLEGPLAKKTLSGIFNDQRYTELDDQNKQTVMAKATSDAKAVADYQAETKNGQPQGQLTQDQQDLMNGKTPDYLGELKVAQPNAAQQARAKALAKTVSKPGYTTNEKGVLNTVQTYARAFGTSPKTAFERIFTGQKILRVDNGAVIVQRMSENDSEAVKKQGGGDNSSMKLDHTVPLQLGGSNETSNLKLVPTATWAGYTPVEDYLGTAMQKGAVNASQAHDLITQFKSGKLTANQVFARVGLPPPSNAAVATNSISDKSGSAVAPTKVAATTTYTGGQAKSTTKGGSAIPNTKVKTSTGATVNAKDPVAVYQAAQTKYNNDVKAGKLTDVQQSEDQAKLAKQSVTSKYAPDVTQLYGMSASSIASYLGNQPAAKATTMKNELLSLDSDLINKGVISKSKFSSTGDPTVAKTTKSKSTVAGGTKIKGRFYAPKSGGVKYSSKVASLVKASTIKGPSSKLSTPSFKTKAYKVPKLKKLTVQTA